MFVYVFCCCVYVFQLVSDMAESRRGFVKKKKEGQTKVEKKWMDWTDGLAFLLAEPAGHQFAVFGHGR